MFKKQEVYESTLKYFHGDTLATNVWMDKYCLKNNGEYMEKSPLDMHRRIAKEFARIEQKYPNPLNEDEIYNLLATLTIIPGGSLLYGIGNKYSISSLGNCFVIGNEADSYGGICTTDQEQAQLMKRRAGVGHDISHLRPADTQVTNAAGTSTGAVSFMHRFSNTTREVAQNGRRGALMLSMDINHPDVENFITAKDDLTKVTGANISVKITDDFMKCVENDELFPLRFPTTLKEGQFTKDIPTRKLWNLIIKQAHSKAEPGVLFWDKIKSESIPSCYGKEWEETSTNPCGEIPLCPYDSCRLLSVNLTVFVKNPFTKDAYFDWDEFKKVVYIAQKLMDDVIDLEEEKIDKILNKIENDPEPKEIKAIEKSLWLKIRGKLLAGRRTGLSGIGLADMLASINLSYTGGISMAEATYKTLAISAYESSIDMARDRGAFPIFDYELEKDNPFIERINNLLSEDSSFNLGYYGRRNVALLTIPPSGTISLLAGISSGIEPVYQLSYTRRRKVDPNHPNISFVDKNGDCWEEYEVFHPSYQQWLKTRVDKFENTNSTDLENPYKGSTAYELNPLDRVKMQGAIQKWIDHSISSTINLPKEITEEEVSNIYVEAWKQGLKGVTIYRDGSRDGVLINNDTTSSSKFHQHDAPKRPKSVSCDIFTPTTHGQQYVVVVGIVEDKPYELFAFKADDKVKVNKGYIKKVKRGRYDVLDVDGNILFEDITSDMTQIEQTTTRLISWGLRHGAGAKFLVEQLSKDTTNGFQAFSRIVGRVMKKYIKDNEEVTGATCDSCGSDKLIYKDGCVECESCGVQKC